MLGNDIVDLSDPETSRDASHSRFDQRVFAPAESRSLPTNHSDRQKRWILWSAKEAAYKAARRESVEVIFSPARFVVDLDRSLCGSVRYESRFWPVRVQIDGDCVHAVVSENAYFVGILSATCRLTSTELHDPSEAIRRFALSSIASELGLASSDLRIEKTGRIPKLIIEDKAAHVALSLSHHGSYAGYACCDPRIEGADRISRRATPGDSARVSQRLSSDTPYAGIASRLRAQQGGLH